MTYSRDQREPDGVPKSSPQGDGEDGSVGTVVVFVQPVPDDMRHPDTEPKSDPGEDSTDPMESHVGLICNISNLPPS